MNDCSASNFQKRSSEVAHPALEVKYMYVCSYMIVMIIILNKVMLIKIIIIIVKISIIKIIIISIIKRIKIIDEKNHKMKNYKHTNSINYKKNINKTNDI